MKTLTEAAIEFEMVYFPDSSPECGAPWRAVSARVAFLAGAAAMAEQFAQGSGPMLEAVRGLKDETHTIGQILAERLAPKDD